MDGLRIATHDLLGVGAVGSVSEYVKKCVYMVMHRARDPHAAHAGITTTTHKDLQQSSRTYEHF